MVIVDLPVEVEVGIRKGTLGGFNDQAGNFKVEHVKEGLPLAMVVIKGITNNHRVTLLGYNAIDSGNDWGKDIVSHVGTDNPNQFIGVVGRPVSLPVLDEQPATLDPVDIVLIFQVTDRPPDGVTGHVEPLHQLAFGRELLVDLVFAINDFLPEGLLNNFIFDFHVYTALSRNEKMLHK